jgi:hypothetical protein
VPIHSFAQAALPVLRDQAGLIVLCDEIIEVMVGFQNDVSAAPPVSSARPALGPILLTLKGDAPLPAVPRARINFDLIHEHIQSVLNLGCHSEAALSD